MSEFSKGEWTIIPHKEGDGYTIKSNGRFVAKIPFTVPAANAQHAADTRLIVEAPEMYSLLEKTLMCCRFITRVQNNLKNEIIDTLTRINNEKITIHVEYEIEHEPPKLSFWIKPLVWLFDWWLKRTERRKEKSNE